MATIRSYFPTGIVTGSAFCNREKERDYLEKRLIQNAHVALMSPRRYGKSSLIAQFTQDQKLPFASVDLLPATNSKYVRNTIIDGVTHLLDSILPTLKKPKEKLMAHFARMNPVIELSAFGQNIKLKPDEKTPEETIMKLLLSLDKAAKEMDQRLVFVMDEFQQIALLENSHALEASIRHAVERSRHVFYIFSGSNRTLLEEMFKNKDRPLYHLCDEMKLHRIAKEHYFKFITKAAKKTWKTVLTDAALDHILELTGCHPYYVNRLCRMLWDLDKTPTVDCIRKTWAEYAEQQKVDWATETIARLSINQIAVLKGLADAPEKAPRGKHFINKLEMSSSSVQRTISDLLKKDFIYKDTDGFYQVLNPVIKAALLELV